MKSTQWHRHGGEWWVPDVVDVVVDRWNRGRHLEWLADKLRFLEDSWVRSK